MLTSFHLRNFKSLRDERLTLPPITLLYGANSSGKSSLIQGLLLLKQSMGQAGYPNEDSPLDFRGPLVDLGGFGATVNGHDLSREMVVGVEVARTASSPRPRSSRLHRFTPVLDNPINFTFTFAADESRRARIARVDLGIALIGDISFTWQVRSKTEGLFLASPASAKNLVDLWRSITEQEEGRRAREDVSLDADDEKWLLRWLRETPLSRVGLVPAWSPSILRGRPGRPIGGSKDSPRRLVAHELIFDWQNLSSLLHSRLANELTSIRYVGPLRQAPQRLAIETSSALRDLGPRGERTLRLLSADPDLLRRLNAALALLDIPYEVDVKDFNNSEEESLSLGNISVLTLKDRRSGLLSTLADVGFGVSQILPVLMQLLAARRELVVVEQPEVHLHPRLQARLADIMVSSVVEGGNRLLLETHSEHFLSRIQRRIRAGVLDAGMLNVAYVDKPVGQDQPLVTSLRLDREGELLDAWPSGFFDDRLEDLLADDASSQPVIRL